MFVAKSLDDLKSRKLKTEQNPSVYLDTGSHAMLGSDLQKERPVDLKSGESADAPNVFSMVVRSVPRDIPGTVTVGEHFVQISMWVRMSIITRMAQKQRRVAKPRWVKVLSQPVRIQVPANPRLEQCE